MYKAQSTNSVRWMMLLWLLTVISTVVSLQVIFLKAPTEATMGIVQKIFYFHVPAANGMYLGASACFVGSVGYLARGTMGWDALARGGADVAVIMGMMVLISGPLWAAPAWGAYWTWDPRLTTSMLSQLIYVAYIILRSFSGDGEAERRFAAALGILGAATLPIIKFSVQKFGGQHPRVISKGGGGLQHPDMVLALVLGFITFLLLVILLVWQRARAHIAQARLIGLQQQALELGVGGE